MSWNRNEGYNPIGEFFAGTKLRTAGNVRRLLDAVELADPMDEVLKGWTYREFFEEYMVKWLKACYFCMIGKKYNDVMLILIGDQGTHKTSFLNHLVPPELKSFGFMGYIEPRPTDYQTASLLVEKVFINVDDQLQYIFGKDYNSMKSIISQDTVTRRLPYQRHTIQQKRIANFCGSVNEREILQDSNDGRFLCFRIKNIGESYSKVDAAQLWAEIAEEVRVNHDSADQFNQKDYALIDIIDERYINRTTREEAFLTEMLEPAHTGEAETYYLKFSEILTALNLEAGIERLQVYNLKVALRKHGFTQRLMRRPERDNIPNRLYAVHLKEKNPCRQYIKKVQTERR